MRYGEWLLSCSTGAWSKSPDGLMKPRWKIPSKFWTQTPCQASIDVVLCVKVPVWLRLRKTAIDEFELQFSEGGRAHGETFRPSEMVAFIRKQKPGGWVGPARILACEGKNVGFLHSGIPILVASNRIRGANAEEDLEPDLLDKSRLSRKKFFMEREAARQPHRLDSPGQQPYMDMRPQGHGGGRTTDDDDAKRIRSSGNKGGHSPVRSTPGDPTSAPPVAEQPP
eukprot:s980_g14.t1